MCTETILKTIQKTCEGKCEYFIHQSDTTNSVYCTLRWGNAITHFRISDHKQKPHKDDYVGYFTFGKEII